MRSGFTNPEMSFTYNKRMSNYQSMLPITPNNFHVKRHNNIRGGDFTLTPSTSKQVVTRRTTPSATPATPSATPARRVVIANTNASPPPRSKKNFTIHPPINKTLNS